MKPTEAGEATSESNGTDNNDKKGEEEEEQEEWYFAIGSMMNPISLKGRRIEPSESLPGRLLDHRLGFFGPSGMAEAIPEPGSSFHGVVHRVSSDTMERLDKIEGDSYIRVMGTVEFYDGQQAPATVYTRAPDAERSDQLDKPPSERYVEIMLEGCRHHGVDQSHRDWLSSQESIPRPVDVSTMRQIGPDLSVVLNDRDTYPDYSLEQINEINKDDADNRVVMTINSKVVELVASEENQTHMAHMRALVQGFGPNIELSLSKTAYDPKYGVHNSLAECSREESAYREDMVCQFTESKGRDGWKVIGRFADQLYSD